MAKTRPKKSNPIVGVIMGSDSDWETLKEASEVLKSFEIPHECEVVSAHRTPDKLYDYAKSAESRGLKIIIAAAGGAAHLPGMTASMTALPVLGVPILSASLQGIDSLLSIMQMPYGIPVGTLAIGKAGAKNAALFAVHILSLQDAGMKKKLELFRKTQTEKVLKK